jgi:hypothetical protein
MTKDERLWSTIIIPISKKKQVSEDIVYSRWPEALRITKQRLKTKDSSRVYPYANKVLQGLIDKYFKESLKSSISSVRNS